MNRRARTAKVALVAGAAALLFSCATSKGALFTSVVASEGTKSAQPAARPAPSTGPSVTPATPPPGPAQPIGQVTTTSQTPQAAGQSEPGLKIDSLPQGAHVYVNNRYLGDTPLFYTGFAAGTVQLTLEKGGFYRSDQWVTLDPASYATITFQLQAITGYLRISVAPIEASPEITVDTQPIATGVSQLPIGPHLLSVSAFGYEDFTRQIDIQQNATLALSVHLKPAPFRLTDLTLSRPILNPANPGELGEVAISFKASGPGRGQIVIRSGAGQTVAREPLPPFVSRDQRVVWDGRAADGSPLPDGLYRITVEGSGAVASAAQTTRPSAGPSARAEVAAARTSVETTIQLSRAAIISPRSLLSGVSGLLFAPTPELLPLGSFEISATALAHIEQAGALIPMQVGVRFSPVSGLEVDAQGTAYLGNPSTTPYSIGAAGKLGIVEAGATGGFSAAAYAKATYLSGTTADILTNFTGLSFGLPLEYRLGPAALVFDPEVTLSPSEVSYAGGLSAAGTTATGAQPGLFAWGYGRLGLMFDFGTVMTGLSASLRTQPFSEGLALDSVPLQAGWELHWLLPNSSMVLTALAAGEFSPTLGYFLMGGAGISLLH